MCRVRNECVNPSAANSVEIQTDPFRLKCDEAPEEPATVSTEDTLKVGCHISAQTNFMYLGIKEVGMNVLVSISPLITILRLWTRK